ncbi:RNA polymerase sigma factor [Aquimarina brevivitae]|uniref:RNA polymerase sigma factor (Sigma-70 family) n=1 Tax=Aquimarina brevivitae TaxID=323412 RepID=A0A4Q7PH37_9FLAO|nr:sigma-70 family RNA polymerase sigma factor [Aquimarina brevivitae]RZS99457.1 RNA polymerase sigma factor (sigma-70 family) [Aquimarina brevivitae]
MKTQQQKITGILKGDPVTLNSFYTKNFPAVKAYVVLNKGKVEDAEDIFQEALLLIYEKLSTEELSLYASIDAYCYGVCKNLWRNRLRNNKLVCCDMSALCNDPTAVSFVEEMDRIAREGLYSKYFQKLTTTSRELWKLFFEGNTTREVANRLGMKEGCVRKKKFDAKKQLVQMITKDPMYAELSA